MKIASILVDGLSFFKDLVVMLLLKYLHVHFDLGGNYGTSWYLARKSCIV